MLAFASKTYAAAQRQIFRANLGFPGGAEDSIHAKIVESPRKLLPVVVPAAARLEDDDRRYRRFVILGDGGLKCLLRLGSAQEERHRPGQSVMIRNRMLRLQDLESVGGERYRRLYRRVSASR